MSTDTTNQQSAAADKQTTGVPNKTKVVRIQGNQIPPVQPQQPNTAPSSTVPNNPDDIDIDKFISESTAEIKTGEERETERQKKTKFLTKAIDSRNNFERIIFSNSETGEFIGTKIQYVKDDDGKTVYDYAGDEDVQEHLEFIIPEDDPQDGSPVEQQVTFFWKKPTF